MALVRRIACALTAQSAPAFRSLCSSTPKPVLTETKGNIFYIRINRPQQRNCVNRETANLLLDAFNEFDHKDDVAVAILSGVGGNFCAGYDLTELSAAENLEEEIRPAPMGPTHMLTKKPVIAAVDGYAVAGGLELALLCDLRVVEENTVLGVFSRRFGVPLIDGGTVRLPAIVGLGRALDLILTGRAVSGKEAHEIGLATHVVAVGSAMGIAISLAQCIAKFPPKCVKADRSSTYYAAYCATSLTDALKFEYENGKAVIREEGVAGAQKFVAGMGRHGKSNMRNWTDGPKHNQPESSLLLDSEDGDQPRQQTGK